MPELQPLKKTERKPAEVEDQPTYIELTSKKTFDPISRTSSPVEPAFREEQLVRTDPEIDKDGNSLIDVEDVKSDSPLAIIVQKDEEESISKVESTRATESDSSEKTEKKKYNPLDVANLTSKGPSFISLIRGLYVEGQLENRRGELNILQGNVLHAKSAMWSRKESVCSAVSGNSRGDEAETPYGAGLKLYPFAIALRVRVLQIVCGIGGLVVGAVGWLEERQKPALGLGVPTGAITVIAATTSVYYSRGFGGWVSARSRGLTNWGVPWRALGPSPCAAVPLTLLWTAAIGAHVAMLAFCIRSLMNIGCGSTTCIGVAGAQLSVSVTTLAAAVFMMQLDLRFDASLSPPARQSDAQICTAVSMVPLTSVAIYSGNSGEGDPGGSPQGKEKELPSQPQPPT